jgi:hypothetical protein
MKQVFVRSIMLACVLFFVSSVQALGHEPIFGLGAHTLFKGGTGVEVEIEREDKGTEEKTSVEYTLSYGVTPDFTIGVVIPQILEKKEGSTKASGVGDLSVRGKYRFARFDEPGASTGAAINISVKVPSGDETSSPKLGTGSADYLVGLAVNREGLRHYFFSDVAYRMNTEANAVRKGNVLFFDIAYGIRPWRIVYLKPDLVLVVELNYESEEMTKNASVKNTDTGGRSLFISPGFLLSYRNVMLKGGVQLPVSQELNGTQEEVDLRAVFSVELHL